MLTDAISDCRAAYHAIPESHPVPDCQYIGFRHLRGRQAGGAVDRIVIAPDEPWQYVDVSVRVSVRHLSVYLFEDCAMATFHYSAFHIRVSKDLKFNALLSQKGLEYSIQNSSPLSVRTQTVVCARVSNTSRVSNGIQS